MNGLRRRSEFGFSVLELMMTVSVVAVLGSVAVPALVKNQALAKRSEAYLGLGTIDRMQMGFYQRNDRYAMTISELEFAMDRGAMENDNTWRGGSYRFSITPLDTEAQSYLATATGNLDGDAFADVLVVFR